MYEFNPGLNVVVADNGSGKSKLFNAFSWILKGQVFDSDRKTYFDVEHSMVRMISDKAKGETTVGDEVKCGVWLTFYDNNFEYTVKKTIWGKRIKEGSPTEDENWACNIEDVEVTKKDKMLLDFRVVFDLDEKKRILDKIIRPAFQQYALLQGEEVDKILDFNKPESLKTAIDTLSNISRVEEVIKYAKYLSEKGDEELTKAQKQHAKDQGRFDTLVKERDKVNTDLGRRKIELQKAQEELAKAKEERDMLISSISNAQKRQEIRDKQTVIETNLKNINNQHGEYLNNLNDRFFDVQSAWLLLKCKQQGKKFDVLRDDYLERRKEKEIIRSIQNGDKSFLTKLPVGSPDSFSLQKMLDKQECFVCGREAAENTPAWQYIQSVLHSHTTPETNKRQNNNDFKDLLDHLQMRSQSFYNQIERIEDGIKAARQKDKKYRTEKSEFQQKQEELRNDLLGLGTSEGTDDQSIVNRYGGAERRIQKYEEALVTAETAIDRLTQELKIKNKEVSDASGLALSEAYVKRQKIMNDVYQIATNTKQRIFDEIIRKLEDQSNYYFKELTKENVVDGGIIRIVRNPGDTFSIEIRDQADNKIFGLSEGFQRMKKLAVIMAIISTSERGTMDYPLIADAPLSAFGKGFIRGFFEKVPEVFQQSIVMVKDLYDKNTTNHLNDVGESVLSRIKAAPGSFHMNEINEDHPQIERRTTILRY